MKELTTHRFNKILKIIDPSNSFDFESFSEALKTTIMITDEVVVDNVVDYLVFDMNIHSDADFMHRSQDDLKTILSGINNIIKESWC